MEKSVLYDLHIHTTASDGIYSPTEVIQSAVKIGLAGIAITDHDTVDGLEEGIASSRKENIEFIPGIEMNTEFQDREVHILGYFIDYHDEHLLSKLVEIRQARYDRALRMVSKLRNMGININFEQVKKLAQGDLIGRPHIAQAMVDRGAVFSIKEAFDKYIGRNRPAYVPRYKFTPDEAISLINRSQGLSVLAHPGLIKDDEIVLSVVDMGIKGIEVYYPEHSAEQIREYLNISSRYSLLVTGGSDFHGIGNVESRNRLGCAGIGKDLMQKVYNYCHNTQSKP